MNIEIAKARYAINQVWESGYFISGMLILYLYVVFGSTLFAQNIPARGLPDATEGENYIYTFQTRTAGNFKYTLIDGEIPNGLALQVAGKLTGRPTSKGLDDPVSRMEYYRFRLKVKDMTTNVEDNQWFALKVLPSIFLTTGMPSIPGDPDSVSRSRDVPPTKGTEFVLAASTSDTETVALSTTLDSSETQKYINGDLDFVGENEPDKEKHAKVLFNETFLKGHEPSVGANNNRIPTEVSIRKGDYCIVHLIKWAPLKDGKSEPEKQRWALFEQVNDSPSGVLSSSEAEWKAHYDADDPTIFSDRIYGANRIFVFFLHINPPAAWDIKYKVAINEKIPMPIQNLITLLGTAVGTRSEPEAYDKWGARLMITKHRTSDVAVNLNTITANGAGVPVEQPKEYSKTYDNERKYYWDVSVGVPLKSVRELQFNSEGNRVTTGARDREEVYGFLNIFLKPTDTKRDDFLRWPHVVLGVPIAGKPLQRPFLGLGYGIANPLLKFNVFAGFAFNREKTPNTLNPGDPATPGQLAADLHTRWTGKFTWGIEFPIRQIKDAIKSK